MLANFIWSIVAKFGIFIAVQKDDNFFHIWSIILDRYWKNVFFEMVVGTLT